MRILVLLTCFVLYHNTSSKTSKLVNCNNVSNYWFKNKLNKTSSIENEGLPNIPIQSQSVLCNSGFHCCNMEMEQTLVKRSVTHYNKIMATHLGPIREIFLRQKQLDDFVLQILNYSTAHFQSMFTSTYGLMYNQNKDIFDKFFQQIIHFYKGVDTSDKQMKIETIIDNLYKKMYILVLSLLREDLILDHSAKECLWERFEDIKPFGPYSAKIKQRLRKSLIVTRAFVQSLFIGRDAIMSFGENKVSDKCAMGFSGMNSCRICRNQLSSKPCFSYCMDVLTSCIGPALQLQEPWKKYIVALIKLSSELMYSTNFENVFKTLPLDISNMVMHFQDNNEKFLDKIVKGCKIRKTIARRHKRSILKHMEFNANTKDPLFGYRLQKYIKELRPKLYLYQDLWLAYSKQECDNISAESDMPKCHNKHGLMIVNDKDHFTVAKETIESKQKKTMTSDIEKLKRATDILTKAYGRITDQVPSIYSRKTEAGYDVGFEDDEDFDGSGGSGEGSGSESSGSGSGYWETTSPGLPTTTDEASPPYTVIIDNEGDSASSIRTSAVTVLLCSLVAIFMSLL